MDKLAAVMGVVVLAIVSMVCLALFSAFTISTLWAWFVVPLGVMKIGFAQAYGLGLLVSVFMGVRGLSADGTSTSVWVGILLNILALILGGIAVQFM